MFCHRCGNQQKKEDLFCVSCGHKDISVKPDYSHQSKSVRVFKFSNFGKGRIARMQYFLGHLILTAVFYLSVGITYFIQIDVLIGFCFILLVILYIITVYSLIIRRAHDIGWKGLWTIVLLCIPFANIVVSIGLLFSSGDTKSNKYGPPPNKKENLLDIIFGRVDLSNK